jgi:hypothetical protein
VAGPAPAVKDGQRASEILPWPEIGYK